MSGIPVRWLADRNLIEMIQMMKSLFAGKITAPVWKMGPGELVLVVNKKNKITAVRGDLDGLLGSDELSVKGNSIFSLVLDRDQDSLASAINFVRRSAQGVSSQQDLAITASTQTDRNNDPIREMEVVLANSGETARIRLQSAGKGNVRFQVNKALIKTLGLSKPATQRCHSQLSEIHLADLSHEMKTPLNAILGFTDAIREETFGPLGHDRYREYIDDIHNSGQHLMALIASVLDLARNGEKDRASSHVLTSISELIDQSVAMVRPQLEAAGLRLRVELERDLPDCFLDPQAVRQILINLMTNSIKFTSDGEISILVTKNTGASQGSETLSIIVRDTGIGMSAEQLENTGERFTDNQAEGVRGAGGHGLGLTLAQGLAVNCGGDLSLNSAPGEGMTATLLLPLMRTGLNVNIDSVPGTDVTNSARNGGKPEALVTQMERINQFRERINTDRKSDAA